ncbi:peptide chain release factor 2 [Flavilitoribacter nigricans DSM 23189 = NBRC 102662]|uniref:Peptide chain release factor 2 n=1 Tax=Flavilitoribacter nigricans (strain ATCC 23147 / DSM 23189 / NBRC 102662 / NCIMB 1420 / SS-2) TaxID=1122177 RepID=A0A2D0NJH2_FLAN2|nr:peptide chain release factor 2 [Flavilitoribacter nigricans]PHN08540.1 peptide chain release factor 2 [Flavilitoribacter nigricans DSM 23189 = NBRC 102662]
MTTDQLNDLKERLVSLRRYLDVDERKRQIEDKEQQSLNPNFWDDPKRAETILKELKSHKNWVEQYEDVATLVEDTEVLQEFYQEGEGTEEDVNARYREALDAMENVEFHSTLNQEEDELGAVLEINAGAGGTEACDWAEMLYRMYLMWAEKQNFKVSELNNQPGDVAGIKSASLEISGDFAYGFLKGENGVHRLVRVSPYNAQGKRMTSFASVFVHPMIDDRIEVEVNPADLDWDTFRSSGAGGQHVNKTESAVRVRHMPSGIVVECQQERSQHMNREKAIQMLKSRLYELELEKKRAEKQAVESTKMKNEWGSQIRSYVLDDRRVKDHRTGYQTSQTDAVLDGDLDEFLKAYLMHHESSSN